VITVYREWADLADGLISDETSYYVTSLPASSAGPELLGAHIRGH
jgi:hypothetical protein